MAWVEGGHFLMGSDQFYAEERPVHEVRVEGVWIDEHPATTQRVMTPPPSQQQAANGN